MTHFSVKLSAIGFALGLSAFASAPVSALPALDSTVSAAAAGSVQIEQVKMMHHKKMKHHKKMMKHKKMMDGKKM